MNFFNQEIPSLFVIGRRSGVHLFSLLLVIQIFYSVRGVCEFPASPMKHPNGTLVYCNPDPEKFNGESYYMRYTLNCPARTSCEYIWAGLYVCCIIPEKHVQRKPVMIPLINKMILDAEPKPSFFVTKTNVASTTATTTSTATTQIKTIMHSMESTTSATSTSTSPISTTPSITSTSESTSTTATGPVSFTGTVNSKISPTVTATHSTIAPINSNPNGRFDEIERHEVGSSFAITESSSLVTDKMSSSRPPFSFATQSSSKNDEPFPNFTHTWVVDIADQHLKPPKIEIQRPSGVQRDPGQPSAVPSGYTGVVHWPTTKDPLKFQNQILQDSLSSSATAMPKNDVIQLGAESTSSTNEIISKPQKSADMKNLQGKRHETVVSSVPLTLNDLTPEMVKIPQTQRPNKNKLHFSDFKIITIQCLLLNTDNNVQAYSRTISNNNNDNIYDYVTIENEPSSDKKYSLNEFVTDDIPLCPIGINDGDDLSKNSIHEQ